MLVEFLDAQKLQKHGAGEARSEDPVTPTRPERQREGRSPKFETRPVSIFRFPFSLFEFQVPGLGFRFTSLVEHRGSFRHEDLAGRVAEECYDGWRLGVELV